MGVKLGHSLEEEYRLRVFKNRVVRDEVTGVEKIT
jgi:hypothetical protein